VIEGDGVDSALPTVLAVAWPGLVLVLGRVLERVGPRPALAIAAPLPLLAVVVAAYLLADAPAGTRMVLLIAALFLATKVLAVAAARAAGTPGLRPAAWWLFALSWPGMDPSAFAAPARPRGDVAALVRRGCRNALWGTGFIAAAFAGGALVGGAWMVPIFLVGASLFVHFGVFTLLCAWHRRRGIGVRPAWDAPLRSQSLSEFWAKRWNRGFAEMTAMLVQRPLAPRLGRRPALLASFLVSGLLHEVAISLPVRAGYGLPTAYFLLHGALVAWLPPRHGRWLALSAVVLPLPLVCHPAFVRGVVLPLLP
jgi:alginate O-acetyltransferase complex protein AlgI